MNLEISLFRSKPRLGFCLARQENDLQVGYLFHITLESRKEEGNGLRGREEGGFGGVLEKHRRRGRGWQPWRIKDSARRSESRGQRE